TLATRPGTLFGTMDYMVPEQVRGEPAEQRTDLFAFGTIFYEMLAGRCAFIGSIPLEIMASILNKEPEPLSPDVPPSLAKVVMRCLSKSVVSRFASAKDVAT